jgi:hypothetical protein
MGGGTDERVRTAYLCRLSQLASINVDARLAGIVQRVPIKISWRLAIMALPAEAGTLNHLAFIDQPERQA